MTDAPLTVRRWTRYGKDRLYVATADGVKVGWLDLVTGDTTVERPEFSDAFHQAVQGHQSASHGSSLPPPPVAAPATLSEPPAPDTRPAVPPVADWTELRPL